MRIVLDLQGCQSVSRLRGIGRYSIALAKAIVRNAGEHQVWIVLSDLFPGTIEPIRATFAELQARLAGAADGCMVEQTGGICVLRVHGRRCGDLLQRMGAASAIPGLGLARGGRLAEVHVLTVCIQEGEFLLFVERVYADHLVEWMRATVADFS